MKTYNVYIVSTLLFCYLFKFTTCQAIQDVINLKSYLFITNPFDQAIRPSSNQASPTNVSVAFSLGAIHEVNQVQGSLKTTGTLSFYWTDESLVWTPTSFNGITELRMPQNEIWKPDIALKNSLLKYKRLGDDSQFVYISNTGLVEWFPVEVFLSTCAIDVSYFPQDVQTCTLTFVAWSYKITEVILQGKDDADVLMDYTPNSAWEVVGTRSYVRHTTTETEINFEFKLKRKPVYSLVTLVFPVIILFMLNLFVFALPSDSGEKSGYAVTIFLSFTVFISMMDSSFPQQAESTPYYSVFVMAGTIQSVAITIVALVMIRCVSFGETSEVPAWLAAFVNCVTCKCLRGRFYRNRLTSVKPQSDVNEDSEIRDTEKTSGQDSQENKSNSYTWKKCMDILDILMFCFFTLIFLIITMVYFIVISTHY